MDTPVQQQGRSPHARKRQLKQIRRDPAAGLAEIAEIWSSRSANRARCPLALAQWERRFQSIVRSIRTTRDADVYSYVTSMVHLAWNSNQLDLFSDLVAAARRSGIHVRWSAPTVNVLGPAAQRTHAWVGAARVNGPGKSSRQS